MSPPAKRKEHKPMDAERRALLRCNKLLKQDVATVPQIVENVACIFDAFNALEKVATFKGYKKKEGGFPPAFLAYLIRSGVLKAQYVGARYQESMGAKTFFLSWKDPEKPDEKKEAYISIGLLEHKERNAQT